jgi:hypothetical protein
MAHSFVVRHTQGGAIDFDNRPMQPAWQVTMANYRAVSPPASTSLEKQAEATGPVEEPGQVEPERKPGRRKKGE